jgi:hypothetical protein
MIAHLAAPVAVWIAEGLPDRLVWDGRRYRVSDTPTAIREDVMVSGMTHPIARRIGFRMQVTGEDGQSAVVDVHEAASGEWTLVAVYD